VGDVDGSDLRRVAGPWLAVGGVEFSPDGTLIAVEHTRRGLPLIELVEADGSGNRRVGDFPAMSPTFRPGDNGELLFRGQEGGRWSFYLADVDGGDPVRLDIEGARLEGGGYDLEAPAWSPTGDRLAFHSLVSLPDSQGQTNGHRIHVADIDAGGRVSRVRPLEFDASADDEMNAQFTPDGTQLVFMQRFGLLGATDYTDALWIASAEGGTATPLGIESANGDGLAATIAPDGTSMLAHLWKEAEDWLIDPVAGTAVLTDLESTNGASWQRTAP
jgi:Tol biopolymer transport system component